MSIPTISLDSTLSFSDYRELPGVNLTRLKLIDKSPLDYQANIFKETDALRLGRAIHAAVLEPHRWLELYAIYEGERKAGDEWEDFCDAHLGADILSIPDATTASAVARAVKTHATALRYFKSGTPEVSIQWQHPIGIACKSRLDWLTDDLVLDLKTARDVTPRKFAYQAAQLHYHAQAAFYHDAAKSIDGRDRKVVLLAVEKEPPFNVVPYVLPAEAIQAGRRTYQDWLLRLKHCQDENHWPGVAEDETELHLPEFVFSAMDDATLVMPDGQVVAI